MRIIEIVMLVIVFLIGLSFLYFAFPPTTEINGNIIEWLTDIYADLQKEHEWISEIDKYWTYILGYLFATVIAHFSIAPVLDGIWDATRTPGRAEFWQPRLIGFLERILYVGAIHAEAAYIIPAWLVLKVAGRWRGLGPAKESGGRLINNNFLIGNLMSLIFAILGAYFGKQFNGKDVRLTTFVFGVILVLASVGSFILWLCFRVLLQRPQRLRNWEKITRNMSPIRVLERLGAPDQIEILNRTNTPRAWYFRTTMLSRVLNSRQMGILSRIDTLCLWHYYKGLNEGLVFFTGSEEGGYRVLTHTPPPGL